MTLCDHIKITCTVCLAWINLIDWLVFNANFSSISAISWCEQILYYIKLDTYKIIRNKTYLSKKNICIIFTNLTCVKRGNVCWKMAVCECKYYIAITFFIITCFDFGQLKIAYCNSHDWWFVQLSLDIWGHRKCSTQLVKYICFLTSPISGSISRLFLPFLRTPKMK